MDIDANGNSVTIGDAAGNEIAIDDSGDVTFAGTATLALPNTADPTTDGMIAWDSTEEVLEVGDDGAATLDFYPGTHTADQVGTVTDGQFCQGGAGSVLDCDVATIDEASLDTNVVLDNAANTYTAGAQDFSSAASVTFAADEILATEIENTPAFNISAADSYPEEASKTLFDTGFLTAADDVPDLWIFSKAVTVTAAKCISTGGTSVTVTIEDDASNDLTASCVCATTLTTCSLTANDSFSANERADWTTESVNGNVTSATMVLYYDAD